MNSKVLIALLILLNVVVLMGQIFPDGAPPFAVTVNIFFLVGNLLFLLLQVRRPASTT